MALKFAFGVPALFSFGFWSSRYLFLFEAVSDLNVLIGFLDCGEHEGKM
jgi:hypothetical protein